MGRVKSDIPRGTFFLRPRANAKGEQCVYLRYYIGGKYVMRSCEVWLSPDDWDQKHQEVKAKNRQASHINQFLIKQKQQVEKQMLDFCKDGGALTPSIVMGMLEGHFLPAEEKARKVLFIPYCLEVNDTLYERDKFGASVWYNNKCYINQFEKFLRKKLKVTDLALSDMNIDYINKWLNYQVDELEKKSRAGINHTITPLVNAVRYAKDNKMFDYDKAINIIENAYLQDKTREYNPDAHVAKHHTVKYLTEEQLQAFKEYVPKSIRAAATRDIMDIFLFSYYSCGLRVSDLVTLEWSQIDMENQTIDKMQVKTKNKGKIKPRIAKEGMEILKRWRTRKDRKSKRFVFDLMPDDFDFKDQLKLKMRVNACTRTINQSLNTIGKNLGFEDPLSIHVARHTFCVHAISKGASLQFISQIMGHESMKITEKVYAEFLQSSIDDEMSKLSAIYG